MSTRSSARNLFPPLDNPELTIQRRSRVDPTLLNDFEMAIDGNGDPLVLNLRTMEESCQPCLNGWGGPIALIAIQATNFRLKNDMIQQSIKVNGVTDDALCLLKAEMAEINKNLMKVLQINQQVKAVTPNCETCGGPHSYNDCLATVGQTHSVYTAGAYNQGGNSYQLQGEQPRKKPILLRSLSWSKPASSYQAPAYQASGYQASVHQPLIPQPQVVTTNEFTNYMKANDAILKNIQTNMTSLTNSNIELKNMFGQFMKMNTASSSGSGTLPSNIITNPKEDLKGITTQSGTAYQGPTIPTTSSSLPKVVERDTEVTKDTVPPTNNRSTKDVQPPVVQVETPIPSSEPVVAPVSASKPDQKLSIPYPSRLHDQKIRDKANDQKEKIFQIFQDLNFNISFADALIHMPKFGPAIKIWNKLSLPELSPTCMTLKLANRSISYPVGVVEDVFIKVGTFHFPTDFVVVDFDADPRVPLILGRSFLKTEKYLIDVYEGELTLRVSKEAITFNLDQTSRYSANYNDLTAN
uniref:Reverse transcriptase domain-containing protein n=1 Tax=Tanacetum cinerariifolium TaxID=118510 RepID=A0A6L2J068_TANCI|nr:reverse transcriptase domain-containing protein [Tanacetum cinerariifolium]